MGALGIKIPGAGPGKGPILLPALYSLGVDDYTHRYASERITGAVGATATSWPDAGPVAVPFVGSDALLQVAEVNGFKFIKKLSTASVATPMRATNVLYGNAPQTLVVVCYATAGSGFISVQGIPLSRAGNGSMQWSGTGGYTSAGVAGSWEFTAVATDGDSPVMPGDFTFQRGTTQKSTFDASTVSLTPGSVQTDLSLYGLNGNEAGFAEIVIWNRRLSNSELTTVRAAMQAKYPMF